jgi:hypothetical protein
MKRHLLLVASFFLAVLLPSAEGALINPNSQSRSTHIWFNYGGNSSNQGATASGYVPFNHTNSISAMGREPYWVEAIQNSQIGTSSISATGSVALGLGNALVTEGAVKSDFKVTFHVTQTMLYSLSGSLFWDEIGTLDVSSPYVILSNNTHGVVYVTPPHPMDAMPLDFGAGGTLPVGTYTLLAHASATNDFCCGATKRFAFDFSVIVKPPDLTAHHVRTNGFLSLSWSNSPTGFQLHSRNSLSTNSTWQPAGLILNTNQGVISADTSMRDTSQFFILK